MRLVDKIFYSMLGKGKTAPYIDCDYIESNGTQWVETDYLMTDDTELEGSFMFSDYDSSNSNNTIIGLSQTGRSNIDRVASDKNNNRIWSGMWRSTSKWFGVNLSLLSNINIRISASGAQMTINNNTYNWNTGLVPIFSNGGAMSGSRLRLLSKYDNFPYNLHKVKILSFTCRESGVVVRDFRPAVRNADGEAGMHDVVNDVFYTNANPAGDNFLYGNLT
jgi:hypothetical protein